jgi:preprotein translocase subunit SecD
MAKRVSAKLSDQELIQALDQAAEQSSQAAVIRTALRSELLDHDGSAVDHASSDVDQDVIQSLMDRLDQLEKRVRDLEPVTDAEIREEAESIEWQLDWGGGEDHRDAVAEAGELLRDRGEAEMATLDDETGLKIQTSQKILRHVRELPWVMHRGGRKYYWVG